jgi:aldose 1-epimerase
VPTPSITRSPFGTAHGQKVDLYTLDNGAGMVVMVITYGATVTQLFAPDRHGRSANVVLGLPTLADYVAKNSPSSLGGPYFGSIVGRYANRIAKGTFTLDGRTHRVGVNAPPNSLHGGLDGLDHKVWTATEVPATRGRVGLELSCTSPDLEEGFPGALAVGVTYTLTDGNVLQLDYRATTSETTVVNLTSHIYWNLGGEAAGPIDDHVLRIDASHYTPVDEALLPTGEIAPVAGTQFDFTRARPIGNGWYDHNFVLDRAPGSTGLIDAAGVHHPASGRRLDVLTTEPGIQFYTGNFLDGTLAGTSGKAYRQRDGFALETQHFPDSPNHPNFPSTVLHPGETFASTTVFRLSTPASAV